MSSAPSLHDFSLLPCNWEVHPPPLEQFIEVRVHADELGFHAFAIPHLPWLSCRT
jgi:hypothetical protein